MKKARFWIILSAAVAMSAFVAGLCACKKDDGKTDNIYMVAPNPHMSCELEIGDEVDYKQYFLIVDQNGNRIVVTDAMLDTSKADTTKEGQFTVTLTIGNTSEELTFTVKQKDGTTGGNTGDNTGGNSGTTTDELKTVLAKYVYFEDWNFAVTYQEVEEGSVGYEDYYQYYGKNISYTYDRYDDDDNFLGEAVDYLGYDASQDAYYLYYDNLNGTYSKYKENTSEFSQNYNLYDLDLTTLGDYKFTKTGSGYDAAKPNDVGNVVIGQFTGYTWSKFTVQIANGHISQIDAMMNDGFILRFVFSKYGSVSFTLPNVGSSSSTITTPTGAMDKQTYNQATFDYGRLQDKITTVGEEPDSAIGLPSKGTYSALVVPIQFSNTSISDGDLSNLNIAFNGTEEQTGWESVKTYYQKASYGNLNLSFDIAGYNIDGVSYFTSSRKYSYYETLTATEQGQTYNNGDNVLLHEVLKYYETKLDLTKYDTNKDGAIDAVYLIYSAPVDYSDDSFYWAYVTWNYEEKTYDGKDTFYYLFAGFDFMDESVKGKDTNSSYPVIDGLKVNASTYIHETGHLLGLDDYYDYSPSDGSNEGLGGADMMDYTVGDQNVYSKTMLGWLTPQIVTTTQTVTIKSSQERGDAILIPLNFNNSYFCEYLLIDLYSANGLNELHSDSLYGGAAYGVRIYHVSSSINNPYGDEDYSSFTDNNNSTSEFALIKLVEADGETQFASTDGEAAAKDLWKAGSSFSKVFPNYTTNAGKTLIFDIKINSVSATEASITITYNV